jgi:cytochrome P450
MARKMIEEDRKLPPHKSQLNIIPDVAGLVYTAGSDTTVTAVNAFFLAMLVYPDVQAKAQAEIDRVVGTDRLPEMKDCMGLPYVEGVMNECLRWLPVAPMGELSAHPPDRCSKEALIAVPHRTSQDDEYRGYFIPKGSLVLGSVW